MVSAIWVAPLIHFASCSTIIKVLYRYGKGQRGTPGEHFYAHFFGVDHASLPDLSVNIIDKTDFNKLIERKAFWI